MFGPIFEKQRAVVLLLVCGLHKWKSFYFSCFVAECITSNDVRQVFNIINSCNTDSYHYFVLMIFVMLECLSVSYLFFFKSNLKIIKSAKLSKKCHVQKHIGDNPMQINAVQFLVSYHSIFPGDNPDFP